MSLLFRRKNKSIEHRWIIYAMLRDNVQHHLEDGKPSSEFSQLHKVTEALGGLPIKLDAFKLQKELNKAKERLPELPVDALAVSVRTLAVINLLWPPPGKRETMLLRPYNTAYPLIQINGEKMRDVFGVLIDDLLRLIDPVQKGDELEVVDL